MPTSQTVSALRTVLCYLSVDALDEVAEWGEIFDWLVSLLDSEGFDDVDGETAECVTRLILLGTVDSAEAVRTLERFDGVTSFFVYLLPLFREDIFVSELVNNVVGSDCSGLPDEWVVELVRRVVERKPHA